MRNLLVTLFTLMTVFTYAQSKGSISGMVQDKDMGLEPLAFVSIYVSGNPTVGTTTDFDGNYKLALKPGSYTIIYEYVGYKTVKKQVAIQSGVGKKINVVMETMADALEAVIISVKTNKESETALIAEQKEATVIIESIGAEQLSSQGVSDAAAATTKVTGVSKQQGSSKVYVRGLGDRYNNTTLNGLPLPSNNPSLKNISLDLFSTDVLQNVGISKTFSSNISGDLSGANINIETKQASSKPNFSIGLSTGVNSQTTFNDFKTIDGANYLGVATEVKHPINSLRTYAFDDNFSPKSGTALPKIGISLNGGRKFRFDNGTSFSYFLVGSFGNSYRFTEGFNTNNQTETSVGSDYYDAKEYTYSTSKLAMGNFEFAFNSSHKILFNTLFVHSNSQKIQDYFGDTPDNDNVNVVLQTQNQNKLLVNQLISKNSIGDYLDLDLGVAFNNIKNDEPNRKKNVFIVDPTTGNTRFSTGSARNNSRYYHNLNENDLAARIDAKIYLGEKGAEETKGSIDLGYSFRNTERNFEAFYFDHDQLSSVDVVDRNDVGAYINQQGLNQRDFRLITGFGFGRRALDPFTYGGTKTVNTGSINVNYNLSEKMFASIGTRVESINMDVNWITNLTGGNEQSASKEELYVLPSLNLKYSVNDENQFRLSASQTYTFPQFKEIAEFVYEGVNYQEQGNSNLQPSENYNLDIKYEYFPEDGGLLSATVFGKMIKNSINRIEINAASDNVFSYENTGDAQVYGIELEYRTDLLTIGDVDSDNYSKLKLGANGTYMYTNQDFEPTGLFSPTNTSAQLEGAAPLIFNTDLSYSIKNEEEETILTIIGNYQADKLYSIGSKSGDVGLENIVQKSITTLDFVAKHSFNEKMSLKLSVKNILNPAIETERDINGGITNTSFKRGVDVGISFGYKF